MARMGMDVDQVEQTGRRLKNYANSIDTLVSQLDKVVNALPAVWQGPDAQRFVTQWWPEHRKSLVTAKSSIDGLGQSALNNASEQRQVSGEGGHASSAATSGSTNSTAASSGGPAGSGTSTVGADAVSNFVAKWQGKEINFDRSYGAQCYDVFRQYNADLGIPNAGMGGSDSAADLFKNYDQNGVANHYDRISHGQGAPQPGDLIVYGGNNWDGVEYGHVAVVTAVDGDRYEVLEQNYTGKRGPDGWPHDPAAVRAHSFSEKGGLPVLGYLRPKG